MAEEEEPKHPYVSNSNAKVHLIFSIVVLVMSLIQLILGIVVLEKELDQMVGYNDMEVKQGYYHNFQSFDNYFYGDHVWIAFMGIVLSILGLSVYRSRSRANGVMLSVMCILSGFLVYPVAEGLGIGFREVSSWRYRELAYEYSSIRGLRTGSGIFTIITNVVVLVWGFYAAGHACCNTHVRKQTRVTIQPQQQQQTQVYTVVPYQQGQQQVMYTQQVQVVPPQGQYVQQGGAPPQGQYLQQGPPQYIPPAVVPAQIYHGGQQPPQRQDSQPPAYTE